MFLSLVSVLRAMENVGGFKLVSGQWSKREDSSRGDGEKSKDPRDNFSYPLLCLGPCLRFLFVIEKLN